MVVPITLNPNFFPYDRGKKISGRKDGQVKFDEYLLERMEPVDASPESGRDDDENAPGQYRKRGSLSEPATGQGPDSEQNSQGGEYPAGPQPGRRIDLQA